MTKSSENTATLQETLDRISATKVDYFEADLKELQYGGDHYVKIGLDAHELAPEAWSTFSKYLDLPEDLLPQLKRGLGNLVFRSLNALGRRSKNAPEEVRFSYDKRGRIISLTPTNLVCLPNDEIVRVIEEATPGEIISKTLSAKLYLTETEFQLDCYTKRRSVQPRKGDILHGGVSIRHSQTGTSPTVVLGYVHRLVCTNGMTQRVCLAGKPARTKRCKAKNSKEPVREAIRGQIGQAWTQLQERLDGLKELTKHRLETNGLPERLRRRWSINKEVAEEIAKAFEKDELARTHTEYDLVNALSRVATHSQILAPRYRRHLSLAAGMLAQRHVHQCPMCGNWLDGIASN